MLMSDLPIQDGMLRSGMVAFHADLATLMRPIDDVEPAPYNYNNGDVDAISESIEINGVYRPVYVQRSTGHIIAGNHTWMACKKLGAEQIPVVVLDVSDTQAKRIMVADNQTARLAEPDNGLLVSLLNEIEDEAGALLGTGFSDKDAQTLRHLNEIPLETEDFAQWPTFSVQLPPHVLREFRYRTREAEDDRQAFELMMRFAGWEG